MKHGQLISLALAIPALVLGACGGGAAGVGTMNATTGGTSGTAGDTSTARARPAATSSTAAPARAHDGRRVRWSGHGARRAPPSTARWTLRSRRRRFHQRLRGRLRLGAPQRGSQRRLVQLRRHRDHLHGVMPPPNGTTADGGRDPRRALPGMFAMHFSGMGCSVLGAGVGTDLDHGRRRRRRRRDDERGEDAVYDVSAYTGINSYGHAPTRAARCASRCR